MRSVNCLSMVTLILAAALSALSCHKEPDRLSHAESLYAQGKPTEALRLAFEAQQSDKHRDAAASLISKISSQYLVVTSEPQSLEVYLSPIAALDELPEDSDPKTPLAEAFGEKGIPRTIGCKTFSVGLTPVALPKPTEEFVVAILYTATEGGTVAGKRAFDGAIEVVRGEPSFFLTAMGGWAPRDGSFCLWDDARKRSGQIQMLSSGRLVAVALFWNSKDRESPAYVRMTPEELYESLADKSLNLQ